MCTVSSSTSQLSRIPLDQLSYRSAKRLADVPRLIGEIDRAAVWRRAVWTWEKRCGSRKDGSCGGQDRSDKNDGHSFLSRFNAAITRRRIDALARPRSHDIRRGSAVPHPLHRSFSARNFSSERGHPASKRGDDRGRMKREAKRRSEVANGKRAASEAPPAALRPSA